MELSDEQRAIINTVLRGRNILITGEGGTGKSFLLRHIMSELDAEGIHYGVCGSTGVSAVNVGGVTLHSWCGIGLGDGALPTIIDRVRNNVAAFNRIRRCKTLLIDEISMIPGVLFGKLDGVFRTIREEPDLAFGGMQIIMFGDFLQLPPVEGGFAFQSKSWKWAEIETRMLTRVFRQEDIAFSRALGKIRRGELDEETKDLFNSRANASDPDPSVAPVIIAAVNRTVDAINSKRLEELTGDTLTLRAKDEGTPAALRLLEKSIIPEILVLKPDARVMCCVNLDPEQQIMNGTTGRVVGFVRGYPEVMFDNGAYCVLTPATREVSVDGNVIGSRTQVPLKLAWAVTSHRIQGSTLDKAEIHMRDAFEPGQTYVALSRVRTLGGLFIKSINKANLTANPLALKFYDSIESTLRPVS